MESNTPASNRDDICGEESEWLTWFHQTRVRVGFDFGNSYQYGFPTWEEVREGNRDVERGEGCRFSTTSLEPSSVVAECSWSPDEGEETYSDHVPTPCRSPEIQSPVTIVERSPAAARAHTYARSDFKLTCNHVSKTPGEAKVHQTRHHLPFTCTLQDCPQSHLDFPSSSDLDRHRRPTHSVGARTLKYWKCFAPCCPKANKEWPRLDNFKQHLVRMHEDQPMKALIQK